VLEHGGERVVWRYAPGALAHHLADPLRVAVTGQARMSSRRPSQPTTRRPRPSSAATGNSDWKPYATRSAAHIAQIFEDLHGTIERRRAVDGSLLRPLVETERELLPQSNDRKIERARRMVVTGESPSAAFMLAAAMS
jgi:hypothetical protein